MDKQKKEPYCNYFSCRNCGEYFYKYFEFGQVAEKGACPHCGVSDSQLESKKTLPKDYLNSNEVAIN